MCDWTLNWGDVPTWITALATILALIAAVWAVRASWSVLRLEQQREDRAEKAEEERREQVHRAAQADAVAGWIHRLDAVYHDVAGTLETPPIWGAKIVNVSLLPVYDVKVGFHRPNGRRLADVDYGLLPPGETFVASPVNLAIEDPVGPGNEKSVRVEVEFRDTAGRVWLRDRYGLLTLVQTNQYIRTSGGVLPSGVGGSTSSG